MAPRQPNISRIPLETTFESKLDSAGVLGYIQTILKIEEFPLVMKGIRGFKDILPGEVEKWQFVEHEARRVFGLFGFLEMRIPILERTELFARSIGEATDIVGKEMYTFPDRDGDSLTLRPEATASIMRAYLEHGLNVKEPVGKYYFIGPMFRYERPQKGRYRQFHQIDAEILGVQEARADAEILVMLMRFLTGVGLKKSAFRSIRWETRPAGSVQRGDSEIPAEKKGKPLRRLPEEAGNQPPPGFRLQEGGMPGPVDRAPVILDFLCADCRRHFDEVKLLLDELRLPYTINPRMVRGLDYYTRTAFEVVAGELGAQNAVCGGGRYDGLAQEIGGPPVPGSGLP